MEDHPLNLDKALHRTFHSQTIISILKPYPIEPIVTTTLANPIPNWLERGREGLSLLVSGDPFLSLQLRPSKLHLNHNFKQSNLLILLRIIYISIGVRVRFAMGWGELECGRTEPTPQTGWPLVNQNAAGLNLPPRLVGHW